MWKPNPELYARLSAPRALEEAKAVSAAFEADLMALREKHGIPELVCSACIYTEGSNGILVLVQLGNAMRHEMLMAHAFRKVQEERNAAFVASMILPPDDAAADGGVD